jgi:hypothetical protein
MVKISGVEVIVGMSIVQCIAAANAPDPAQARKSVSLTELLLLKLSTI